ncbi:tetratricopeptide repeat protein [Pseudoduganella sp. R-31]|uniref:tetratricopeptide repeat protein n=1 Tax=Pseudoduganella sp. R-31 TaxID=3404060 RepID=UPI003CF3E327
MSMFIAIVGIMSAIALACVVPPLMRRSAGEAHAPGSPSGQRPQTRMALALTVLLPAAAVAIYMQVGRPDALAMPPELLAASATPTDHGPSEEDIPAMVERLAERLRTQPQDVDGWHMLARSYSAMNRYADAAKAYGHLATLLPQDAGLLADYADALATAQGGALAGEPERLIERSLAIDPQQPKALALSGSAAFARGDFARAEKQWQAVLPLVPEDSEFARSTHAGIAEARARQGIPAAAIDAPTPGLPARLSGTVRLAPGSTAPAPGQVLFIFARSANGSPMPLAAIKRPAGDFPLQFVLDDSNALAAGTRLAEAGPLIVGARISASGSATPQAGDLEGQTGPVRPGASGLAIELAVRPPAK